MKSLPVSLGLFVCVSVGVGFSAQGAYLYGGAIDPVPVSQEYAPVYGVQCRIDGTGLAYEGYTLSAPMFAINLTTQAGEVVSCRMAHSNTLVPGGLPDLGGNALWTAWLESSPATAAQPLTNFHLIKVE